MSEINTSASAPAIEAPESESLPQQPIETPPAQDAAVLAAKQAEGEKLTKKEEKVLKEYKLKVNGREKTIKFDPSNDEEMLNYLQKAEASDSKFKEAAEVRKAAIQFIDELKKNPRKVLSDPNIGVDLKKFAEEIMNEQLQDMEKTPEQRALEQAKKELEALKKQREDEVKAFEQKEFERLQAEHERQLETDISAALDIGGLPKTARTVKNMAEMMMIALQNGIDLTPQEIAPIVKNNNMSDFKEMINSLSDDQLDDFLGKEVIGRLRKKNVAKAKAIETANAIKPTGEGLKKKTEEKPAKKMTIREALGV